MLTSIIACRGQAGPASAEGPPRRRALFHAGAESRATLDDRTLVTERKPRRPNGTERAARRSKARAEARDRLACLALGQTDTSCR